MDDFSRRRKERHQKKKPDHLPIIFNEGDILTFTCTLDFEIGGEKARGCGRNYQCAGQPVWMEGHEDCPGGRISLWSRHEIVWSKEQAFYKFFGSVMENGGSLPVDPCGY